MPTTPRRDGRRLGALAVATAMWIIGCGEDAGHPPITGDQAPPLAMVVACTAETAPFDSITASADWADGTATPPNVVLVLEAGVHRGTIPPSPLVGYAVAGALVTGGKLIGAEDKTKLSGYEARTRLEVTVAPDSPTVTEILADVDLTCAGSTATKHFNIAYHVPTGISDRLAVR